MNLLRDRRNLIVGGLAGAALLGALALGIGYFVVFAGSSPQKLALSSPTASPSSTASSDSSPSALRGLTTDAGNREAFRISADGALALHGVPRTVTIPIVARPTGSEIELVGSITFPFSDFGTTPPSIGGFVSVQDNATMEFQVKLARSGA